MVELYLKRELNSERLSLHKSYTVKTRWLSSNGRFIDLSSQILCQVLNR